MPVRSTVWTVVYFVSWALAPAPAGMFASQLLLVSFVGDAHGDDTSMAVGAVAGSVLGLLMARATRRSSRWHRSLRVGGAIVCTSASVAALLLFALSRRRQDPEVMFSGLDEFLLGLLCVIAAGVGVTWWLAGISGRRALGAAGHAAGVKARRPFVLRGHANLRSPESRQSGCTTIASSSRSSRRAESLPCCAGSGPV